MAFDRKFLLLSAGEVLVVAATDLLVALLLQAVVLGAFLEDRRGYGVFAVGIAIFAGIVAASGTVLLPLLGLAVALGCGYLALTAYDYRLTLRAGERA